jgi:ankyrin repeat protein
MKKRQLNKALRETVSDRDLDAVKGLLEKGADPNARPGGWSVLRMAVISGHEGICRLLLEAGANPNKVDRTDGVPPLIDAVLYANAQVCRLLLEAGAAPNATNPHGITALDLAAYANQVEICRVLIAHHADLFLSDSNGDTPLDVARGEARAYLHSVVEHTALEINTQPASKLSIQTARL